MINFDRQYTFRAGTATGIGFELGTYIKPSMPLRINFQVEKTTNETPDTGKISLWNLSPENIAILNQKDCVVELRAGYGESLALVIVGIITFTETLFDGADRETYMEIRDSRIELRDTYVTLSYAGLINSQSIIRDIATEMGVVVNFAYNCAFHNFPKGFAFVGLGRVALDKACASSGLRWKLENGVLHVKMNRSTMNREVYVLSSATGLIRIPKRINHGSDTEGEQSQPGWEVEYFMNATIGCDDFVRLSTGDIEGFFRVKQVFITGDNKSGDWICKAQLIEEQ